MTPNLEAQLVRVLDAAQRFIDEARATLTPVVPLTEAIETALLDAARPLRCTEIRARLTDRHHGSELNVVSTTVYGLWKRARVAKVGRGTYCHVDHIPPGSTPIPPTGS